MGDSESEQQLIKRIKATTDFYSILGLQKDASDSEIKKAYRKLALRLHPDKTQTPGAEDAFKKVQRAFDVLGDQDKKSKYDQFGAEAAENDNLRPGQHPGFQGFPGGFAFNGAQFGNAHFQQVNPEDLFRAFFAAQNMQGQQWRQAQEERRQREGQARAFRFPWAILIPFIPVFLIFMQIFVWFFFAVLRNLHILIPIYFLPPQFRRYGFFIAMAFYMMRDDS
uniref:J domain-containing protein n=1 Tax=Eutreptiella gymnastica TaxID=73025 RepID=A0A7S1ISR0_9EUGL|mmetsp:Transcript_40314/g.72029  ORF Transcript_40314/g.72029 Transcript_40314/m.72029 type:complete len:223 (+) Transcript_40314:33-701(+)